MKGLHVVKVISAYWPLVGGGEKQAQRQGEALVQRGHRVTVLTRRSDRTMPALENLDGVEIVRVSGSDRWGATATMLKWLFKHRREIDLIHAHQSNSPLVVAVTMRLLCGIAVVCTPMTCRPELQWVSEGGAWRRWFFRWTSHWIAISDQIYEQLMSFAPANVERIPNGVDKTRFTPVPHESTVPTAIFVGRLAAPKRVDTLLEAWSKLRSPARLLVVGDGPLKHQWMKQAQELRLANVEFLGMRSDVEEILRRADIFTLTTDLEGMPNALLEAMSTGLPCVATGVGAIPELLKDGVGVIVPPGDVWALAEALEQLLTSPDGGAEMGRRARVKAEQNYSLRAVVDRLEEIYYRVLGMEGSRCVELRE